MTDIKNLNHDNFNNEVSICKTPLLVDFWAEWCGPCKMLTPILEEISNDLNGKIQVAKVNLDDNQELAMKYSIRSIPTLILIKDGAVHAQHIGAASKAQIQNFINQNI